MPGRPLKGSRLGGCWEAMGGFGGGKGGWPCKVEASHQFLQALRVLGGFWEAAGRPKQPPVRLAEGPWTPQTPPGSILEKTSQPLRY